MVKKIIVELPPYSEFSSNRGFSLIEVIIAIGIMMAGLMALLTITDNQIKQTAALSEKLAAMDIQTILISTLADGSVCNFVLTDSSQAANRSSQIFDSTNSSSTISLQNIPLVASSSAPHLAQVGAVASVIAPNLLVQSIQVTQITGGQNRFIAVFKLNLGPGTVSPIRPVTTKVVLQTDPLTPPNSKKIVSCAMLSTIGVDTSALYGTSKNSVFSPCAPTADSGPPANCSPVMDLLIQNHGCKYLRNAGDPQLGLYGAQANGTYGGSLNHPHDGWMSCPRGMYLVGITDDSPDEIDSFCCPFVDPNPGLP